MRKVDFKLSHIMTTNYAWYTFIFWKPAFSLTADKHERIKANDFLFILCHVLSNGTSKFKKFIQVLDMSLRSSIR